MSTALATVPTAPRALTTGQISRICGVAPRTVSKWFDSGRLKGYRLPGSTDRRVYADDLAAFMLGAGMRVPADLAPPPGPVVIYGLSELVPPEGCTVAATAFDLGALVGSGPIAAAVLGDDDGSQAVIAAAVLIRGRNPEARLFFALSPDVSPVVLAAAGFGDCPCVVRPVAREKIPAMLAAG